jgi:hypothetical protein
MTPNEIIRIADGVVPPGWLDDRSRFLVHFAQLVIAADRQKICKQIAALHDSLSLAADPTTIRVKDKK